MLLRHIYASFFFLFHRGATGLGQIGLMAVPYLPFAVIYSCVYSSCRYPPLIQRPFILSCPSPQVPTRKHCLVTSGVICRHPPTPVCSYVSLRMPLEKYTTILLSKLAFFKTRIQEFNIKFLWLLIDFFWQNDS